MTISRPGAVMSVSKLILFTSLLRGICSRAEVTLAGPLEAKLQGELLAPCCYRQTLDHHMSDAATAMKAQIREMVANGKTEREIVELYKSRYGPRILAEPEGATWWIGTLTPLAVLAIGAVLVIRKIAKWSPPAVSSQL
jgi:cytochrome c-type biogenesis protein CcmH